MNNKLMAVTVAAVAVLAACTGKKTAHGVTDKDTASVEGRAASENGSVDLASAAGTYEGTFPAADGPGIKTVLAINGDSTYLLKQDYLGRRNGHDETSGVFKVLVGNVLMLVRPSSGERTFYKVRDANTIVMTDSAGNEPEGMAAESYVLKKR